LHPAKLTLAAARFGSEPGQTARLRVNPQPALANVYQRPAGIKL
jgi:hypothetical protein